MRALAGFIAVIAFGLGCAATIPHATPLHAERTGVALQTLEHGRGLFVTRCGSCHFAPDPGSRNAAQWAVLLPDMLEDSKLSKEEAGEVLAFLQALAAN